MKPSELKTIIEPEDLDVIEQWILERANQAAFVPADVHKLANYTLLMVREVRAVRLQQATAPLGSVLCSSCGTHEVSLEMVCHNSACVQYAKEHTVYEGWKHPPPITPKTPK